MAKKVTQEEFINRSKKLHNDNYEYILTEYVSMHKNILITCKKHGVFTQTPSNHLSGKGCKKCGVITKGLNRRSDNESFIQKSIKIHGELYDYSKVLYEKSNLDVEIICKKHGIFKQTPNAHLTSKGCNKCGTIIRANKNRFTINCFINKAKITHNNFYNYEKTKYIKSIDKVIITCPIHGDFEQIANSHIQGAGCYECGELKRINSKKILFSEFIKRAVITHSNKYTYIEDSYDCITSNINIICKEHGVFSQIVNNHLSGQGCYKCGQINRSTFQKENPTGWSYNNWFNAGKRSKDFESFKVYIIKCWDENEEFYKIGKSFLKLNRRFHNYKSLPYNYSIVKEIVNDAKIICELEWTLKNCNKNNKYVPIKEFGGRYECFKQLNMSCFENYNLEIIK